MNGPTLYIVIAAIIIGLAGIAALMILARRKTERLQTQFGPEYARAIEEDGRRQGEAGLRDREKRVETFSIRPLTPNDRNRYAASWGKVQAQFVDDPNGSVTQADALLGDVMTTRGYPLGDFEQRSADISVDHPVVVENYRAGHDIAVRQGRGEAGTEDLRQAMLHYRILFEDLVGGAEIAPSQIP